MGRDRPEKGNAEGKSRNGAIAGAGGKTDGI